MRRYEVDVGSERGTAVLRLVAAVCVLLACAWAALSGPLHPIAYIAIALSLFGVAAWFVLARKAAPILAAPDRYALTLDDRGLTLGDGDKTEHVAWPDLAGAEVDEERLVITVTRRDGSSFAIAPRYAGVGLHDLCQQILDARP